MARGSLRIYLGAAPGVGKTYAMLDEGYRRRRRGTDTVVGVVETHGRASTSAQLRDLEVIPRKRVDYRGAVLEEMDVDAVLARHPQVVLVDELAHTNVPGSRHEKRWQDIEELLDAGIDVISTVNVQHLESLNDVVAQITGVTQQETVPDAFVRSADQIELVDMTPEALRRRMAHGNIYPPERIDAALANYFRPGNLGALRELALLWVADRVQDSLEHYLADHGITATWETREKVVVSLSGSPSGEGLIRRAARMAGRTRGELVGVRVVAADGLTQRADPAGIADQRTLLQELGGVYHEVVGDDVASALAEFARAERATQLVIGTTQVPRWRRLLRGSIVNRVIERVDGVDVHVIAGNGEERHAPVRRRRRRVSISYQRQVIAWSLVVFAGPVLLAVLVARRDSLSLATITEAFLAFVVLVAAVGGLVPALVASLAASLAINWYFTPPIGTWTIAEAENVASLVVFIAVALLVSFVVDRSARQSQAAQRARTEAESMAWSTSELVAVDDPLPRLVEHLRATFGQDGAAVFVRSPERWSVVVGAGAQVAPPPGGTELVDLAPDEHGWERTLVLDGRALDADERRVLGVLAGNLIVALDTMSLAARAEVADRVAEADALRTALLQAVSHDLRTPLATIKAYVSGLRQPDVQWSSEEVDDALGVVESECDRLNRLVGNLLDASRLQVGALTVSRRPVAIDEIVTEALVGTTPEDVTFEVDPYVALVDTDPVLLERALANVVENAVRHTPAGVAVQVRVQQVGEAVHVRVVDRGPGIPAAERGRVFQPFQRSGDTDTWPGVGLGLAIARGFTDAIGAELELDDTPGGGLTVTFRVPVAAGTEECEDAVMTRILVVDDEPQIRRALRLNLTARGYEVLEAATGPQALQMTASERPDLVLLDLGLPGMSGLDVLPAIRGWSNVPIIVLTVRDEERTKVKALDEGADDYVTKPFGMDELLARLRAALRRSSANASDISVVETDEFVLDLVARTARLADGRDVRLTPTEWSIVDALVHHPHRLMTYRMLVDAVWGPTYAPDFNLLRVHLSHIRRKLEDDPARPRHFVTEPGMGCRYVP